MDDFLRAHLGTILDWLSSNMKTHTQRRKFLLKRLANEFTWKALFPRLALVSCWTHALAKLSLPALKSRLGAVLIEPKGLLSTEGLTSIPVHPNHDPVISLGSHFLKFRPRGSKDVFLAHQLKSGRTYEVIMTTGGGLYRYATGDFKAGRLSFACA